MNITVLTNGSEHGMAIIKQLAAKNVAAQTILLEQKFPGKKELKELRSKLGGLSFLLNVLPTFMLTGLYRLFRKIKYNDIGAAALRPYADQVIKVPHFNGPVCEKLLKKLKPDLLILGGTRIIKENILTIPQTGTLNAHPGLLPFYRGVDVVEWALYQYDPVGVTVHVVHVGIDTGPICRQKELQLEGATSLTEIKSRARNLAGILMAETVIAARKAGKLETVDNEIEKGNYFKKMPPEKREELLERHNLSK